MAEVFAPGATENDFLARFQAVQGNPSATTDDMYAAVMGKNLLRAVFDAFASGYAKVTDATDAALVTVLQRIGLLEASSTSFVAAGSMTTANLLTNYPPSATNVGKYARVSDLYGSVDDVLRCRFDGVNYRWVPQRADFNTTSAAVGTIALTPLITPPTVKTPGTLTGNIVFSPSAANAYIGQRFRVVISGGLGVNTAQITGLVGSNITLLGNTAKDIEYSSAGWFAVSN